MDHTAFQLPLPSGFARLVTPVGLAASDNVIESTSASSLIAASRMGAFLGPGVVLPSLFDLDKGPSVGDKRKALADSGAAAEAVKDARRGYLPEPPRSFEESSIRDDTLRNVRMFTRYNITHLLQLLVHFREMERKVDWCMDSINIIRSGLEARFASDGDKKSDVLGARTLAELSFVDKKLHSVRESNNAALPAASLSAILENAGRAADLNGDSAGADDQSKEAADSDTDEGAVDPNDEGFSTPKGALLFGARKRVKLPDVATTALRKWLDDHQDRPYPSEDDKKHLTAITGLTLVQINNWFSNARRRYLPKNAAKPAKTIEGSNSSAPAPASAAPPASIIPRKIPLQPPATILRPILPLPANAMTLSNMVNHENSFAVPFPAAPDTNHRRPTLLAEDAAKAKRGSR